MGGTAAVMSADKVILKARIEAAEILETAVADVEFANGHFPVACTDRTVTLYQGAGSIESSGRHLAEEADFNAGPEVISNGVHIC